MGMFTFTFIKPFFLKVSIILSQILTFNQRIRIIRHLGCYQANEINAEAASDVAFKYINCLVQDMNAFNLQLQMHNVLIY